MPSRSALMPLIIAAAASAVALAAPGAGASPAADVPPVAGDLAGQGAARVYWVTAALAAISLVLAGVMGLLSFRGLDRGGARDVSGLPAWQWFLAAGLVYGTLAFTALGVAEAMGLGAEPGFDRASAFGLVVAGIAAAAAIGLLLLIGPRTAGSGLRADLLSLPIGFGAFLLTAPVVLLVMLVGTQVAAELGEQPDSVAHDTLRQMVEDKGSLWFWLTVLNVVLLTPIVEEILYRGLIQSGVRRLVSSPWAASALTSVLFTLMHVSVVRGAGLEGAAVACATLFTLSLALGAAFERTGRIGVPIVMHALFNASQIFIATSG